MSLWLSPTAVVALCLALVFGWAMGRAPARPPAAPAPGRAESYYVFLYRPGPAWRQGRPVTEQPLEKHFAYMGELQRSKVLVLGGPFEDSSGAMGVIVAASLADAVRTIDADPIVADGVVTAEVRPWHAAAPGCVESKPFVAAPAAR